MKRLRIPRRKFSTVATGTAAVFGFVCCLLLHVAAQGNEGQNNERDDAAAAAAFETIIPVLRHPRCMNCHRRATFLGKETIVTGTRCRCAVARMEMARSL
jgi:hypothetical protein